MTGMMKAAVYRGKQNLVIENVPIPEIGPNDVLAKVIATAICGSDLHSYRAGFFVREGQILGHEYAARAVAVGKDVQGIKEGDRVWGMHAAVCGTCYYCTHQLWQYCPSVYDYLTGYGKSGGYAEYVSVRQASLGTTIFKFPDEISDECTAVLEPISFVTAVIDEIIKPGEKVVVLGAGLIGNICTQLCKLAGAECVVTTDISPLRLKLAKELGADYVINAREENDVKRIHEIYGTVESQYMALQGLADITIDCSGAPGAFQTALEITRAGGKIALLAPTEHGGPVDVTRIVVQKPFISSPASVAPQKAIDLMASGQLKVQPLITHKFPLDEINAAFEMQMRPTESLKVLVVP